MIKQNGAAICFVLLMSLLAVRCNKKDATSKPNSNPAISITTPLDEPAYIYVDGKYTGASYPEKKSITVTKGHHTIGLALKNSNRYLLKNADVEADISLAFTSADQPVAKVWKALWIGVQTVTGSLNNAPQQSTFTTDELNACFDYFQWSINNLFIPYSYGTMNWQVTRQDIATALPLSNNNDGLGYVLNDATVRNAVAGITPGNYDCVFVCWKQKSGSVDFGGNYFGLAGTDPISTSFKTGYVQVKFTQDPYGTLSDKINNYKNNDPGVWIHEWLHTVGEHFYQNKGYNLPLASLGGGFSVHAAESYGYTAPWMNWYKDFVSGRVPSVGGASYLGIGPEALLKCTVRETAVGCSN
jgi:hypothetical protein